MTGHGTKKFAERIGQAALLGAAGGARFGHNKAHVGLVSRIFTNTIHSFIPSCRMCMYARSNLLSNAPVPKLVPAMMQRGWQPSQQLG